MINLNCSNCVVPFGTFNELGSELAEYSSLGPISDQLLEVPEGFQCLSFIRSVGASLLSFAINNELDVVVSVLLEEGKV